MKRLTVLLCALVVLACLFSLFGCSVGFNRPDAPYLAAGVDPVLFMAALAALVSQAKELGATPESLMEQIRASWGDSIKPPSHPILDAWGRIKLKSGRLIFCPVPLIEKWEGLTRQQVENIRGNCAVDALGRWKWTDEHGVHYVPAAFSGFYSSASPPEEFIVSGWQAQRWDGEAQPDGTTRMVYKGLFAERTYKTHFISLDEAEAHAWPV